MPLRTLTLFGTYFLCILAFLITYRTIEAQIMSMVLRINAERAAAFQSLNAQLVTR